MAMAILAADGSVSKEQLAGTVFVGELGVDGRVRPVPGVLPSIAAAAAAGFGRAVVPVQNAAEAALVPSMQIVAVPTLGSLIESLAGGGSGSGLWRPGAGVRKRACRASTAWGKHGPAR
jgi:magnesium chelatase family protein